MPLRRTVKFLRFAALAVLLCCVVFAASSALLFAEHQHHNCDNDGHCEVCLHLQQALQGMKLTALPAAALLFATAPLFAAALFLSGGPVLNPGTPVAQKVKLTH